MKIHVFRCFFKGFFYSVICQKRRKLEGMLFMCAKKAGIYVTPIYVSSSRELFVFVCPCSTELLNLFLAYHKATNVNFTTTSEKNGMCHECFLFGLEMNRMRMLRTSLFSHLWWEFTFIFAFFCMIFVLFFSFLLKKGKRKGLCNVFYLCVAHESCIFRPSAYLYLIN